MNGATFISLIVIGQVPVLWWLDATMAMVTALKVFKNWTRTCMGARVCAGTIAHLGVAVDWNHCNGYRELRHLHWMQFLRAGSWPRTRLPHNKFNCCRATWRTARSRT